jgi:hypothetical protein
MKSLSGRTCSESSKSPLRQVAPPFNIQPRFMAAWLFGSLADFNRLEYPSHNPILIFCPFLIIHPVLKPFCILFS